MVSYGAATTLTAMPDGIRNGDERDNAMGGKLRLNKGVMLSPTPPFSL